MALRARGFLKRSVITDSNTMQQLKHALSGFAETSCITTDNLLKFSFSFPRVKQK